MKKKLKLWRTIYPICFLFTMVAGFFSNLLFPAKLPFLFKDIIMAVAYFFFFTSEDWQPIMKNMKRRMGNAAWITLAVFFFWGFFQIFNPLSAGLLLGVLGFKIYYFYWPLAILGYAYVNTVEDARKLIKAVILFSIPTNLFGIYQFYAGPGFLVSTFGPGFSRAVIYAHIYGAEVGESFFRIIGTFPSTGQYTHFLVINSVLCFAYLFSARKKSERIISSVAAIITFIALLMTGSRAGIIILAFCMVAYAMLSKNSRPVIVASLIVGGTLYFGFNHLGSGVTKRFNTLKDVQNIAGRSLKTPQKMFIQMIDKFPIGQGLGSASTGAKHLPGIERRTRTYVENYPAKLQVEAGLPGVILFYSFVVALMVKWRMEWFRYMGDEMRNIAVPLTAYCFVVFTVVSVSGIIDSAPIPIFLWGFIGIVAKLADLSEYQAYVAHYGEPQLEQTQ